MSNRTLFFREVIGVSRMLHLLILAVKHYLRLVHLMTQSVLLYSGAHEPPKYTKESLLPPLNSIALVRVSLKLKFIPFLKCLLVR